MISSLSLSAYCGSRKRRDKAAADNGRMDRSPGMSILYGLTLSQRPALERRSQVPPRERTEFETIGPAPAKGSSGWAIRDGIPIVFSWFGANRRAPAAPQQGFARTALWHLDGVETAGSESLTLTLCFSDGAVQLADLAGAVLRDLHRYLYPDSVIAPRPTKRQMWVGDMLRQHRDDRVAANIGPPPGNLALGV